MLYNPLLSISDLDEYCSKYVEAMGIDAEGLIVDIGILPSALRCRSYLCFLDRESPDVSIRATHPDMIGDRREPYFQPVHILLQPGHFDIIYPKNEREVTTLINKLEDKLILREIEVSRTVVKMQANAEEVKNGVTNEDSDVPVHLHVQQLPNK